MRLPPKSSGSCSANRLVSTSLLPATSRVDAAPDGADGVRAQLPETQHSCAGRRQWMACKTSPVVGICAKRGARLARQRSWVDAPVVAQTSPVVVALGERAEQRQPPFIVDDQIG